VALEQDGLHLACKKHAFMEWEALGSNDEQRALEAVDRAEEVGDLRWVRPLLEAFRDTPFPAVRQRIGALLGSLKVSAAADIFVDALDDPGFQPVQADIISFLWNAGFVEESALRKVVHAAVSGDFRVALEAMTWIDQTERIEDEHALLESILMVRGGLEDPSRSDIHPLLAPMLIALESHERTQ